MATPKKVGGAKTTRTETVTVRLDPELRYLAEIAARTQRRTLSSYIEWAIEKSLEQVLIRDDLPADFTCSIAAHAKDLWDVDEPDRFIKLALIAPGLLNYDEQKLWKLIKENGAMWRGTYNRPESLGEWSWEIKESEINHQALREHWPTFVAVAGGEASPDELPTWEKGEPIPF
jgi:hypothetical protein